MVTWPSVVSVMETGVEKVVCGVSVTVLVIVQCVLCGFLEVPRPVGNPVGSPVGGPVGSPVTGVDGNGATDDSVFEVVTEALPGTAGRTGEMVPGNSGAPGTVGKDSVGKTVLGNCGAPGAVGKDSVGKTGDGKTVLGNSGAPGAVGEGSEGQSGDDFFGTGTEALLGIAGRAGETVLGDFGAPGAVGEGRGVVWAGGGDGGSGSTTVDLAEVLDEAEDDVRLRMGRKGALWSCRWARRTDNLA
ncbi:hypothetical protein EDB86DRAFT_2115849 [Lactarius hatsudake]|nr:hypothetical protein EDB86DRAFT_2115849 [Lactarius hatsudake]